MVDKIDNEISLLLQGQESNVNPISIFNFFLNVDSTSYQGDFRSLFNFNPHNFARLD